VPARPARAVAVLDEVRHFALQMAPKSLAEAGAAVPSGAVGGSAVGSGASLP
jgi:hypothetical protein